MKLKKMTYEEFALKMYNELIDETESDRVENRVKVYIKEMLVRNEMMKHDFTKRQINLLMFLCNHSYALFKESALIPKIQDFEIAGVSRNKAKQELKKLEEMNVITWTREDNIFTVNNPVLWDVPINAGYSEDRSKELFLLNLRHSGDITTD